MTLPASGLITLGDINEELGRSRTAAIQLDKAENGDYGTINTCSPFYPVAGNPAKISEWYGYNHNAVCSYSTKSLDCTDNTTTELIYGDDWSTVSQSQPKLDSEGEGFSVAWWNQIKSEQANEYYFTSLQGSTSGSSGVTKGWHIRAENQTNGNSFLILEINDNLLSITWKAQINSSNNTSITSISTDKKWGIGTGYQVGSQNANNFTHLAFTYDSGQTGADAVKMYWNGTELQDVTASSSDTLSNITWDTEFLSVGGSFPGEGGSGCFFDEYTLFYENKLEDSEVGEIYNSGAPQASSNYSFNYDNTLYRFEQSGSLGTDTQGTYDLNNSQGSPASSTEHA